MKKVLIQGRFSSKSHIDSLKDLLELDLKDKEVELDIVPCLTGAKFPVTDYNLIISHPHVFDNCCIPLIEQAANDKIPVVFTYYCKYPHGERIQAIAQDLGLEVVNYSVTTWRAVYERVIRKKLFQED